MNKTAEVELDDTASFEELGEQMMDLVLVYREFLKQTPVVHFRADNNTWLDAIVRYLVYPKASGRVKTRLIRKLLEALNAEPGRVLFPKNNLR